MSGTFDLYPAGSPTILAGIDAATLQAWMTQATAAYAALMNGAQVASASYGQGGGSRSVTYRAGDAPALWRWIELLQRQLGQARRRRARRLVF